MKSAPVRFHSHGHSLIEALVSSTLMLVILLSGFAAIEVDDDLLEVVISRTRAEEESNYRMLALRAAFNFCSDRLRQQQTLTGAPVVFADLQFGADPRPDAFSIARTSGLSIQLQRSGSDYCGRQSGWTTTGTTLLLAGPDAAGSSIWNYARVQSVTPHADGDCYLLEPLIARELPHYAHALHADLQGILHSDNVLYWITSAGRAEPFFSPLDAFSYQWLPPHLNITWKRGFTQAEFKWQP